MSEQFYGKPLSVRVENGRLVIEIGVNTLAHAVAYAEWANPWNDEAHEYIRTFAITDAEEFAKDVSRMMLDEREDGSSPLTDFLDKASEAAVDDGSIAAEYDQRIPTGQTAPSETWAADPPAGTWGAP